MHENLGSSPGPTTRHRIPAGSRDRCPVCSTTRARPRAQLDLTTAYDDTHGCGAASPARTGSEPHRPDACRAASTRPPPPKAAARLTGTLTLDGAGNPNTVFIFQTTRRSSPVSGSTVSLINGAQECNVYWQVLSSATLGSGSTFVGNILALTSITMQDNVTVHGRALARNGSVTLINDHFTTPTSATSLPRRRRRRRPRPSRPVRGRPARGHHVDGSGPEHLELPVRPVARASA